MLRDPEVFWLQRWNALYQAMSATAGGYPQEEPLVSLLKELMTFGNIQFFYFFFGFSHELLDTLESKKQPDAPVTDVVTNVIEEALKEDGVASPAQSPAPSPIVDRAIEALSHFQCIEDDRLRRTPQRLIKAYDDHPDFVLRTIVDQIAYDYNEIFKRAIHQRQHGAPAEQDTLRLADKWGQSLLLPLGSDAPEDRERLLDVDPVVISFFNRSPMIRMIPYADVALVGIPLTAAQPGNRRDLLVLPHELGHYVYWHGQFQGLPLRNRLRDLIQGEAFFLRRWIEEIFADVFGLLISHEPAVLPAALSMLRDNAPSYDATNHQTHPLDTVRLDIYLSVLQLLGVKFQADEDLDDIWNMFGRRIADLRQIAGGVQTFRFADQTGAETAYKLEQIRETVSAIAGRMTLEVIMPAFNVQQWDERLQVEDKTGVEEIISSSTFSHLPVERPAASLADALQASRPEPLRSLLRPGAALDAFSTFFDAVHDIFATADVKQWLADFEDRMRSTAEAGVDRTQLSQKRQGPHAFEVIRDTRFDRPLDPAVWKIVFAAGGWAIKGPETGPVGVWEEEPDWIGSALHP